MTSLDLFRRLLSYTRPYWLGFLMAVIAMVVTAATEAAFPALMKPLLDNGFQAVGSFPLWWVPMAVLAIFFVRGTSTFVSSYAMHWLSNHVLRDIRQELFRKVISLPVSSIDHKSAGMLIAKIITDAQMVLEACTTVLTSLVRDSLVLLGLLAWLLWLNWKLTLIVILLAPALAYLTMLFSRRLRTVSKGYLQAVGHMTATVEEAVTANRVIKVFDGQGCEDKRFFRYSSDFRSHAMRVAIAAALQSPISQFIAACGVALILTMALLQARTGGATVGDFVSFLTAMLMLFSPLKSLANINAQIQRGLAAAESVFGLLDEPSEPVGGHRLQKRAEGAISFHEVTLRYSDRHEPALKGVSVDISPGQTVALVGQSGGGKSSFIHLLPRFYEPTSGMVTLDEKDIASLELRSLRSQISLVSQDVMLFNDSLLNNICYGLDAESASEEKVRVAIQAAHLADFVDSLVLGIHTEVGDRGVRLSGGQKQRVAIARAFLKNAPILLLDEATSALDAESERAVQTAIERLRTGRTTIVVAHRLSTIVSADLILVMEKGEVVQRGTHEDLIAQLGGPYQTLYKELESPVRAH